MAAKAKQMLYTQEGYDLLVKELTYLKGEKREEIKEAIALARSFGDLSENAEYDEARNEQAKTEARISELERLIENAVIVDENTIDTSIVNIGSTVLVYDVEADEEIEYSVVGSNEADPFNNRISDLSPIGRALIGHKAGATVAVETPGGTILYEAHKYLETITLDKMTAHKKAELAITYADLVYNGQWFTPLREALAAFVDKTQENVTGKVKLKLYKGNVIKAGVWSDYSLYSEEIATFGEDNVYNQADSAGFINLFGLPITVQARLDAKLAKKN